MGHKKIFHVILYKKVTSVLTQSQTSGHVDSLHLLPEDDIVIRRMLSRRLIQELSEEKMWKSIPAR